VSPPQAESAAISAATRGAAADDRRTPRALTARAYRRPATGYTTFRPHIGEEAERHQGRRARIQYHEEERNGFHNVHLDAIEPLPDPGPEGGGSQDSDPDEVAWNTAVEAAPWLLGTSEPEQGLSPDELYERLEPFKRRVAEDIRGDDERSG
jgi:hypothetical protein